MTNMVQDDSTVHFHDLHMRPSEDADDEWIVAAVETNAAIALPSIGVQAIEQLQQGATVAAVHAFLVERFQEDIDVADLVEELIAAGLVTRVD